MWPFNKADTDINQASETLSPFISSALSRLEAEDIREQGRFRMLAECYIYGAVRYLASYDEMRPRHYWCLIKVNVVQALSCGQ